MMKMDESLKEKNMRKLTLQRKKSFVGCLATMKIYVEDAAAGELVIGGVLCRKLGTLKNGEKKTFEIGFETVKVFAIADSLSKDYCNEYYQVPAGEEDVFLSGANKFNPASGNAFQFDGNDSAQILQNRNKNTKKGLVVLIVAIVVGTVVGGAIGAGLVKNMFSSPKVEPKAFSDNGMNITLTNEFRELEAEAFTHCYESSTVAVLVSKEAFTLQEGSEGYTLQQYAELVLQNNSLSATEFSRDGLVGFEYEATNADTKETFRYISYVYKSDDAFWLVQFAGTPENVEAQTAQIGEWAKSVSFT